MKPLLLFIAIIIVGGCNRSQSYFVTHPQDRARTLSTCVRERSMEENCQNAAAAQASQRHSEAEQIFRQGIERR